MSRKGENIHKRKDGRWEARILIVSNGKKKYKSIYGKTYREAKEKMLHFHQWNETNKETAEELPIAVSVAAKSSFRSDSHITSTPTETLTFSAVTKEWFQINQLKQKEATKLKYHTIFEKHILPEFGDTPISEIDIVAVNSFLAEKTVCGSLIKDSSAGKGKPLSSSYVRTMGILISSVISFATRMGYREMARTPITKPSENKKNVNVMNKNDQKKLEELLKSEVSKTGIGIMLALHAGLRIGEVCALCWDDIDLVEKVIHVQHTISRVANRNAMKNSAKTKLIIDVSKTKSSVRDIPINSKLLLFLLEAQKKAVSSYVVSDNDSFLSPRTFEYRFHRLLAKYGIEDVNFHVLRHTFSTRCVELDVDIKSLSEVLGHANVSTTLGIYVHSSMDLKRSQLEKLVL